MQRPRNLNFGWIFLSCIFVSGLFVPLLPAESFSIPPILKTLPDSIQQVILVKPFPSRAAYAELSAWEKSEDDSWRQVVAPGYAMIGRRGFAPLGQKKEGDGCTPSGIFRLKLAFGDVPLVETKLLYRQATDEDYWVDDPASEQYNQWITGQPQAASFEKLKRHDILYRYAVVIEYNTNPVVPGRGSAIFLHVWRALGKSTSGCVAVSEETMIELLRWLDRAKTPVIILGDVKSYRDATLPAAER